MAVREPVHPAANEQSLRYLAAELQRAHLQAAQLAGNLAMAQAKINELEDKLEVIEHEKDLPTPDEPDKTTLPNETPEPGDTTVSSHGADGDEAP